MEGNTSNFMGDYIVRATAAKGTVRVIGAVTTDIARTAKEYHNLSPVSSAALGRTLTAATLISQTLKGDKETITIQIKGNGPLGGIVAVSDSKANVRGYVGNPNIDLLLNENGKLDVAGAVGREGYLNVIKDLGLKEPYIGFVRLVSGEIAEDIAYYFALSEQTPSVVSLGVLVDKDGSIINSGGYMIQLMPDAAEETIDFLEAKTENFPTVTELLSEGKNIQEIIEMMLGEIGLEFYETSSCKYLCNCSRDRMERNLISLGPKEILDMVEEQHGAELQCYFCNIKYGFTEKDLLNLIENDNN